MCTRSRKFSSFHLQFLHQSCILMSSIVLTPTESTHLADAVVCNDSLQPISSILSIIGTIRFCLPYGAPLSHSFSWPSSQGKYIRLCGCNPIRWDMQRETMLCVGPSTFASEPWSLHYAAICWSNSLRYGPLKEYAVTLRRRLPLLLGGFRILPKDDVSRAESTDSLVTVQYTMERGTYGDISFCCAFWSRLLSYL